jgi:hypothetical protein
MADLPAVFIELDEASLVNSPAAMAGMQTAMSAISERESGEEWMRRTRCKYDKALG